ncbi:adenylyl-sulfate kinase [Arthrobacter sp. Sr24]
MISELKPAQSLPLVVLSGPALDEMELLVGGLFSPAHGYCLPNDVPSSWPAAFTLEIAPDTAEAVRRCGALLIADPDGTPLVRMDVTGLEQSGALVYASGSLSQVRAAEHPPYRPLRLLAPLDEGGGTNTIAVLFSTVPQSSEVALAMMRAHDQHAQLLLLAVCGSQPHGDYTVTALVDELVLFAAEVPNARVGLLVLPGIEPLLNARGMALYTSVLENLGAGTVLDFTHFSGQVLSSERRAKDPHGTVIFLTGLSGSGKSTLARELTAALQRREQRHVALLDGDDVRRILSPHLGFSRLARDENIRRLGWVAARISEAGGLAICAPIAPYEQTRSEVRAMAEAVGQYLLVHVSTSLDVCESRDRKGLYAKARRGELPDFTGVSAPYEVPIDADLRLDLGVLCLKDAVDAVLSGMDNQQLSVTQNQNHTQRQVLHQASPVAG